MCYACNSLRGASRLSDEEVLVEVRSKWRWFTNPRFLWWLNESPGVGGRLHRSEACAKRDAQFAAGDLVESTAELTETNTPSPTDPFASSVERHSRALSTES